MALFVYGFGVIAIGLFVKLLLTRYRRHLSSIPGPFAASFSNLWKIAAVYDEDMPGWNINVHKKYGPVVRIGPNHVSFASPDAFHVIHAAPQAFAKSDFYEVGAPIYNNEPLENLFSLRDSQRHATLRRNIGSLYTKVAVSRFEPHVDNCIEMFMNQLATRTKDGPARFNMSLWLHLFAYDCLSATNLSKKMGFLEQGQDVGKTIAASDNIFYVVGLFTQAPFLHRLLSFMRSLVPAEEAEPILKFTIEEVDSRKGSSQQETDMLGGLLSLQAEHPEKVSLRDVTAAVFINLTAGHDVLAITLRAVWYYLARNRRVLETLRKEIEGASRGLPLSSMMPYSTVSKLEYLNAIIQETLRIHPNTGTIIERIAPAGGVTIDGYYIPGGTTVGVNAWVIHRNPEIYGHDVDVFRPERWLDVNEERRLNMNRYLFSFGAGIHTCIGKNLAILILSKVIVEFFRRYDVIMEPAELERGWKVHGSWVTKQTDMDMTINSL